MKVARDIKQIRQDRINDCIYPQRVQCEDCNSIYLIEGKEDLYVEDEKPFGIIFICTVCDSKCDVKDQIITKQEYKRKKEVVLTLIIIFIFMAIFLIYSV